MAEKFVLLLFVVVTLAYGPQLFAEAPSEIRDAQRIVVVTDDEGIHYQSGCAFYELRELLATNEGNVSKDLAPAGEPLFEVRTLSRSGNATVYVGDHWMSTSNGVTLLPTDMYERIVLLVQKRKGQGVTKSNVEASIHQASALIQDAAFVEENRCDRQF